MKTLLKYIKWMIIVLTVLIVGYLLAIFFFHDIAFHLNEKYSIYIVIQLVHIAASLSALFVIWSSNLFDKWKKTDQTLLVIFLSFIGLWLWYIKYHNIYIAEKGNDQPEN